MHGHAQRARILSDRAGIRRVRAYLSGRIRQPVAVNMRSLRDTRNANQNHAQERNHPQP